MIHEDPTCHDRSTRALFSYLFHPTLKSSNPRKNQSHRHFQCEISMSRVACTCDGKSGPYASRHEKASWHMMIYHDTREKHTTLLSIDGSTYSYINDISTRCRIVILIFFFDTQDRENGTSGDTYAWSQPPVAKMRLSGRFRIAPKPLCLQ
jgi:hypothetical protein